MVTNKEIAVVVDSSADIDDIEAKRLGIYVVRMPLTIDEKQYIENDEISDSQVIKLMEEGKVVKTSQPLLGNMIKLWDNILSEYKSILFIPISSGLSGTYQSAVIASKNYDGRVVVVDCLSACGPIQVLAGYALDLIEKGYNILDIKEKLEASNMVVSLIPDDLVYLKRGGRISSAAAALADLLKIVPVLEMKDGVIDVLTKVRTKKKAIAIAIDHVIKDIDKDDYEFVFVYTENDSPQEYIDLFEEALGKKILTFKIRSVIMAHTGPKTLGFGRVKKIKY